MKIKLFQKGFNYSQDGPGNRLVYHLQGCNLACPWCANPEGMDIAGGTVYDVRDLADEAARSRKLFFDGGGVTLTGGEPTVQFEAVRELLTLLKDEEIDTAMETNGSSRRLPELFGLLGHLMMDCKHYDGGVLARWTGERLDVLTENIAAAVGSGVPLLVRVPLIGGVNASDEDARGFVRLFQSIDGFAERVHVELLCYHEYGKAKWEKLGRKYTMEPSAFVTPETLDQIVQIMTGAGITLVKT